MPILIKSNATTCLKHRTIALMNQALKTVLKIIHCRIVKTLEYKISDTVWNQEWYVRKRSPLQSEYVSPVMHEHESRNLFAFSRR